MRVLVIGAGLYGRYCADLFKRRGHHVSIVAEDDSLDFDQSDTNTASLVNQARIHNGYHYPRSLATAIESSKNYQRFKAEFKDAIIEFDQYYGIPKRGSLTSSRQFKEFCDRLNVKCDEVKLNITTEHVDKVFDTDEVAIDTKLMMQIAEDKFKYDFFYQGRVIALEENSNLIMQDDLTTKSELCNWNVKIKNQAGSISYLPGSYDLIINCTYASLNKVERLAKVKETSIRSELCEIAIFRDPKNRLKNSGITFMDGPFISFMPWSKDHLYSLTSVCHTPHEASKEFSQFLDVRRSHSRRVMMISLMKKFIRPEIVDDLEFEGSKFVIKTISDNADIDDNRLVNVNFDKDRRFVSILSGKLDAIYEVEKKLETLGVFKCLK